MAVYAARGCWSFTPPDGRGQCRYPVRPVCSSVGYVQVHGSVDDLITPGSAVAGAADSPHLGGIAECFADGGTI